MSSWPELPYENWKDTIATLQLWTQIVGKTRLVQTPWLNHSWHVTLYVTPRGLTTATIPYGNEAFQLTFDFIDHALVIQTSQGSEARVALEPQTVAQFHERTLSALSKLGISVIINEHPNEIEKPIPFSQDTTHSAYDAEYAHRFWRALVQIDRVFQQFRTGFLGKSSPVHFFWGGFDLAVTRFSGREAPPHPGGFPHLPDEITREAYSHEVSSAGFWPGGGPIDHAAFYSYAYPRPKGFKKAEVEPDDAYYDDKLGEFLLPYEAVQRADDPDGTLMSFLLSTYEAAADAGKWPRDELECEIGLPGVPRDAG